MNLRPRCLRRLLCWNVVAQTTPSLLMLGTVGEVCVGINGMFVIWSRFAYGCWRSNIKPRWLLVILLVVLFAAFLNISASKQWKDRKATTNVLELLKREFAAGHWFEVWWRVVPSRCTNTLRYQRIKWWLQTSGAVILIIANEGIKKSAIADGVVFVRFFPRNG